MTADQSTGFECIVVDVDGAVATLTLNRPEQRNTWTILVDEEVAEALAILDADDDIRAVIVTGAGNDFCVGADLSGGDATAGGAVPKQDRPRISPPAMCKPVIAAMNGNAVGIGTTFPMLCDIRIVSETAKVGLPFVRRGVISELNGHWMLPRLVGFSIAADLLLTGRLITGAEAARIGLCSHAVPADEVMTVARDFASMIATQSAPASVAASKRMLWEGMEMGQIEARRRERQLFHWLGRQPDAIEGAASFIERRPPVWSLLPSTTLPSPEDA
jgi:enoyl-CoA hydratase/carnithine racemase